MRTVYVSRGALSVWIAAALLAGCGLNKGVFKKKWIKHNADRRAGCLSARRTYQIVGQPAGGSKADLRCRHLPQQRFSLFLARQVVENAEAFVSPFGISYQYKRGPIRR